ncbi:helix-turn-helix domain-containing protein [Streptomyces sp. NPDC096323]|uniref:TetR/AcrR family transcriptional regulator n=1 Tax=Streptomyces sp. NPDC096323 TaxID=3155822 RepID=UPI0033344CAA
MASNSRYHRFIAGCDSTGSPRRRIVEAAVELPEDGGPDAVNTRAVAAAAGTQPPAIYRLSGDKEGLPEVVAEHGYAQFLERSARSSTPPRRADGPRQGDRTRRGGPRAARRPRRRLRCAE